MSGTPAQWKSEWPRRGALLYGRRIKAVVYGLVDPRTGDVRYIGRTAVGSSRPMAHRSDPVNRKKGAWVASLKAEGLSFSVVVLQAFCSYGGAIRGERAWFDRAVEQEWPILNRSRPGGIGVVPRALLARLWRMKGGDNGPRASLCLPNDLRRASR